MLLGFIFLSFSKDVVPHLDEDVFDVLIRVGTCESVVDAMYVIFDVIDIGIIFAHLNNQLCVKLQYLFQIFQNLLVMSLVAHNDTL